ncbi:hypothetical protein [Endozoicomonas sp. 4G]|uniref:hypothetical protein n=1 Tax=Endozoicomonas sp. 4G TaxID=2872754 RepID=UPI0020791BF5|nr:hypothetical protein [Endozoicomonas sp. 4G]
MYRVSKSYFIFFILIIFAIQHAKAISFATGYTISVNGQKIGSMRRFTNSEGQVSLHVQMIPLSPTQDSGEVDILSLMMSAQMPGLHQILYHWQSLLSGSYTASASPVQNNEMTITLEETGDYSGSVRYDFLGRTIRFSETDHNKEAGVIIGGAEVYFSTPYEGFCALPLPQQTSTYEEDNSLADITTIAAGHLESLGALNAAALSDAHGEPVTASLFTFGQQFEQLLNLLAEGQNHNSGLLSLNSVFSAFVTPPGSHNFEIIPLGNGQEVVYNPITNTFTQKDPDNDPNPCGVISSYQHDSNGIISLITVHGATGEVTFSMDQEDQAAPASNSSSASLPDSAPVLWPVFSPPQSFQ